MLLARSHVSIVAKWLTFFFLLPSGDALQCYTCMGSNNEDCNRQGSKSCPSFSDACAVVVGHDSESNTDSGVAFSSSYQLCFCPFPRRCKRVSISVCIACTCVCVRVHLWVCLKEDRTSRDTSQLAGGLRLLRKWKALLLLLSQYHDEDATGS